MHIMDQFSHDLTIALEETSRMGGVRVGRWGQRRRTRSTGNLPCAPQPTEDSSSSQTDAANGARCSANVDGLDGLNNSIHSDSDDRQETRLANNPRLQTGNLESDSLNENFSPARFFRPSTRRKRKFKRMAVEYETTPTTPGVPNGFNGDNLENTPAFPLTGTVKKRTLRHAIQDSYRANLFFCGKRKRSHRDRYQDHDHGKGHSSSVPRQSHMFPAKHSFQEHKARTRSFSSTTKPPCDRILPLNKGLISKIEKISQQQKTQAEMHVPHSQSAFLFTPISTVATTTTTPAATVTRSKEKTPFDSFASLSKAAANLAELKAIKPIQCDGSSGRIPKSFVQQTIPEHYAIKQPLLALKLDSNIGSSGATCSMAVPVPGACPHSFSQRKKKYYRLRREQLKMQLQFDDPNSMECGELNDFLSSSSLSSSESDDERTNDSDREGDDELTDWPGNEIMNNFEMKNDFKRKLTKKSGNLAQIKSDENATAEGDDTLMSADELDTPVNSVHRHMSSAPIAINKSIQLVGGVSSILSQNSFTLREDTMDQFRFPIRQIESEMSGETSNPFLSSPPCKPGEIREIRAGCRRIKGERPGFSIKTSVNERLARFLQDARQSHLRLPDIEIYEHESLMDLAKLYSLHMSVDNGCAVLAKTSNTTQSVQIDHRGLLNCMFLSDFKRRCYDGHFEVTDGSEENTITDVSIKLETTGQKTPPEIPKKLPSS